MNYESEMTCGLIAVWVFIVVKNMTKYTANTLLYRQPIIERDVGFFYSLFFFISVDNKTKIGLMKEGIGAESDSLAGQLTSGVVIQQRRVYSRNRRLM